MSQINIRNLSNENDDGSPEIVGVSTFSATSYFVPPKGTTLERPSDCEPGSIRFNTDIANLEYFRGDGIGWSQFELVTSNLGGGTGSNTGLGVRGIFAGKNTTTNVMQFCTLSTLGNTQDFGDLPEATGSSAGMASRTRAIFAGGYGNHGDNMSFVTFASTGDATAFGTLGSNRRYEDARCTSSTRGVLIGHMEFSPFGDMSNTIEYITLAALGNAVDFGDIVGSNNHALGAGFGSPTRGVIAGGSPASTDIQFITISTLGNTTDFGDLVMGSIREAAGTSNCTRGIISGGYDGGAAINANQYVTIASTGNAVNFGDMTGAFSTHSGNASPTRAIFGAVSQINIDFMQIATLGDAQDFGELSFATAGSRIGSCSNGHGGL